MKKVYVDVHTKISDLSDAGAPTGEPEVSDLLSLPGELFADKSGVTVSYVESGEGGKVRCEIAVRGKTVSVRRRGAVSADMLFSEGRVYESLYSVPPYSFDMKIETAAVRSSLTERGGLVDLTYKMTVGGAPRLCRFTLAVKD